jgi:hypothetical protein
MAVKFSEFTPIQDASNPDDLTQIVGFATPNELNVKIPPANLDTTYAVSTGNAGASPTISIQGTKPGQAASNPIAPSTVSLTGSGATLLAGNGTTTIDFASTTYALAAGVNADPAVNTPVTLTGLAGGDAHTDTVNLIGTGTVQITSTGGVITIDGGSAGDVTSLDQVAGATSSGQALTVAGTGTGPFTGAVTVASNIYGGTTNVGIVPSGGSATTFLQGDGNWATPDDINTILVTVVSVAAGNRYFIDGTQQQSLELVSGITYRLDQSATTPSPGNSGHPLRFSITSDGTHGGGVEYTTGVTAVGTPGTAGAYTQIIPEQDTPKLYYYCSVHPNMGGEVIDPRAVVVSSVTTAANGTSSSGNPLTITPTSGAVTVASNAFAGAANVGHVPTAAAAASGAFLKQDGTWAVPPGGGGSGSVTNVDSAVTAIPGLTLVTTDQSTTPTVTLGLAASAGANEYLDGGTGEWTALPSAGGISRLVTTDTGDGTTLIFTDITGSLTLPASNPEFNIDIYISGVYQAKASYTYTTATNGTITFASGGAPPNGAAIEYVTTT